MNSLLMQIQLFHQYYDDGVMKNMRLQAEPATQAFLDHYRLSVRQSQGVCAVHYFGPSSVEAFTLSLNRLLDGQALRFNLISSHHDFAIMTDLPVNWCGQLQYSSRHIEPPSGLVRQPGQAPASVLIQHKQAGSISQPSAVGQIVIYPEDLLTAEGQIARPSFAIKMKARLTHWHYYVLNRSKLSTANLEVSNAQGIVFEPPKPVMLGNGEQALLFSSGERSFALSETVKTPFNLLNVMPGDPDQARAPRSSVRQLIVGLPVPRTDVLSIEMLDGQPYVYSPMYVYL